MTKGSHEVTKRHKATQNKTTQNHSESMSKTRKNREVISSIKSSRHASHDDELLRLRRIKGQVEGIENMILAGRYCADILMQMKAVLAALKSVELSIFERHLRHCLVNAMSKGSRKETEEKINEILLLIERINY